MNRENLTIGWGLLVTVSVGVAAVLAMIASPSQARRRHRTLATNNVLHARRIDHVGFGMRPAGVVRRLDLVLRHRPTERLHVVHACGVDHAIGWPGLIVFFRSNRFVGYSYRPAYGDQRVPILATARGLRVGDTLRTGKVLYGPDFHASRHHGGSWWARTPEGTVEGLASGWPGGPRGSVAAVTTDVLSGFARVGGPVHVNLTPQEVAWTVPLDRDAPSWLLCIKFGFGQKFVMREEDHDDETT